MKIDYIPKKFLQLNLEADDYESYEPQVENNYPKNSTVKKRIRKRQTLEQWKTTPIVPNKKIIANPLLYFDKFSAASILLLNILIDLDNKYKNIFVAQVTLADRACVSRQHTHHILMLFEKMGLISRYYRHLRSCHYRISSFFEVEENRKKLEHLLPALADKINRIDESIENSLSK